MPSGESAWWTSFFDSTYYNLWSPLHPPELCKADALKLVDLLGLQADERVLDAPCGYGRMSLPLAQLGLEVTGVDYSEALLERAEAAAEVPGSLRYLRADLRDFDSSVRFKAALNLFSSIGYGSTEDDLRVLSNLHHHLEPGGILFVETMHRDALVFRRAREETTGIRGPNGITLRENNAFDPVSSVMRTTWTWNSPTTSGSKHSMIRVYSATELVEILRSVGFASVECVVGLSREPFTEEALGERLGVIARKAL